MNMVNFEEEKLDEEYTDHIHTGNRVNSFRASLASLIFDAEEKPFTQRLTR